MAQVGNLTVSYSASGSYQTSGSLSNILDGLAGTSFYVSNSDATSRNISAVFQISLPTQHVSRAYLIARNFIKSETALGNHKIRTTVIKSDGSEIEVENIFSLTETYVSSNGTIPIDEIIKAVRIYCEISATESSSFWFEFSQIRLYDTRGSLIVKGATSREYTIAKSDRLLYDPSTVNPPMRIQTRTEIISLTLVRPTSPIATPVRLQFDPQQPFAQWLLGTKNNGIVALGGRLVGS